MNDFIYFKEEIIDLYNFLATFKTKNNTQLFMIHFNDQSYIDWISALIYRKKLTI